MSSLICGLDVHRDRTYVALIGSEGGVVAGKRLANREVLGFLKGYSVGRVAVESSTSIAPLYRALRGEGYEVVVSHPKKTRLIAESWIKSDRVDARAIAELLRLGALPLSYMPSGDLASLREMVRRRAFLVRERAKLKVKIKDRLVYDGLGKPRSGLFTKEGVEWLKGLHHEAIEMYLRLMEPLNREIHLLSQKLKVRALEDEDAKLLMTTPGIGYYSALLIKAEIGSIDRFPDGEKLCSYAGLVPSVRASGSHIQHGSITKEGSRWLRWVMVECALAHIKHDTYYSRFYHRLAQRRGKQVAIVATARKLLLCCYSILKNRKPYHDQA